MVASRRIPAGRLSGLGFTPGAVLTAASVPGSIVLTLREDGLSRYRELVPFARANKLQLLQVQPQGGQSFIELPGYILARAGFDRDAALVLSASYGLIKIRKPLS